MRQSIRELACMQIIFYKQRVTEQQDNILAVQWTHRQCVMFVIKQWWPKELLSQGSRSTGKTGKMVKSNSGQENTGNLKILR